MGQSQPPVWMIADKTVFGSPNDSDAPFLEIFKSRKIRQFLGNEFSLPELQAGTVFQTKDDLTKFLDVFLDFIFSPPKT